MRVGIGNGRIAPVGDLPDQNASITHYPSSPITSDGTVKKNVLP